MPILIAVRTAFPQPSNPARRVLEEVLPKNAEGMSNGTLSSAGSKDKEAEEGQLPEIWSYLGVLVQVSHADGVERKSACD